MDCLGENAPAGNTSANASYCPACIERGWNVQPPPEILPLTPASSRETSPAPQSARDTAASDFRQQPDQVAAGQHERHVHTDPDQSTKNLQTSCESSAPKASVTVPDQIQSRQQPSQDYNTSFGTRPSQVVLSEQQHQEALLNRLRRDCSSASFRSPMPTDGTVNQTTAASRSNRAKSRYQTMPDEVDQALTVIYRELESITALRQDIAELQDRVRAAEQARQISEGRLALERSSREATASKDAEIDSLKQHLADLTRSHELLVQENNALKQRMQDEQTFTKARLEEMQSLKASLRRLLGD
ncbi:uncharacterized protein A1O5_01791 [Cladophialophora psammophila CBS 110553]|uniref:Uncharacterized protein n=1 Tax=Cladophialophora psammophila CBS 110553 TaxID=1182543 RepID=W9XCP9_9EURO|nr:uncharacterized protein A1O5_01791 [Cladophialophora psammophila CBS 110553]EXJ75095.1 hypothetical protein A1O5_01791 [Cladophialophora psammophila CBS 110553]